MKSRRALAATLVLTGGASLVATVPTATAQTSKSVTVTHDCKSTGGYFWDAAFFGTITPNKVDVTYPASVRPGEAFEVTVQPGPISVTSDTGRISYAIALPANAGVLDVRNAGGDSGLGFRESGWNLAVEQVDVNGQPSASGTVAKISGGATLKFGGNENASIVLPQTQTQGLFAAANTTFRLPKVALTLRAPASAAAGPVAVELYAKGQKGNTESTNNTFQASQQVALGNKLRWCGSTYTGSLTSTTVRNEAPLVVPSRVEVTSGDVTVTDGQSTTLRALVTAPGAANTEITRGAVTFRRTDTGAVVGTATPGLDGSVSLATSFPGTLAGYTVPIVASYAGLANSITASASSPVTVTVAPNVARYSLDVTSVVRGTETTQSVPVTVNTAISRVGGGAFPAGLTAQLVRDGQPVGQPRAVTAAGAYAFTDTLPRTTGSKTYYYTVRLNGLVVGNYTHTGATTGETGVIVAGTSPDAPVESHFVDGSVDSSEIFLDRDRFLEIGASSLEDLGVFSSGS